MPAKSRSGVPAQDAPRSKPPARGTAILVGDSVRVWSEVGVTVAVTEDPPQFLRFTFGHERIAKNGSTEEIKRTAALVDEFNEAELERRLNKYRRILRRSTDDDDDSEEVSGKKPKSSGSVRDRVRKRMT